jgi:fatty acid desaturase
MSINNNLLYEKHIEFVKNQLLDNSEIFKLFEKNNIESIKALIKILCLYLFFILIFPYVFNFSNLIGFTLGIILLGTSAYKFQFIIHEAAHSNLFENKKLNDSVGNFFSYLFGMSLSSYRNFHFRHHNKTNTHEDPQFLDALGHKNKNLSKKNIFYLLLLLFI